MTNVILFLILSAFQQKISQILFKILKKFNAIIGILKIIIGIDNAM